MTIYRWLFVSLVLLSMVSMAANAEGPAAEHEAVLARFRSDFVQGVLSGRPERISAHYSEQVRLMPPYQGTLLGKAAADSYLAAFSRRFRVQQYSRERLETLDLGERVLEMGYFKMSVIPKSAGAPEELAGKYLDIWEKSGTRKLEIMTQAWNYDRYPAIESDLRFSDVPGVRMALQAHVPVNSHISFELAALNRLMETAVSQHDDSVWSQFYADDAVLAANHHTMLVGKAAIQAYMAAHAADRPVYENLDIRSDRIEALGRYAIEYATHIASWRNGDHSGVNTGKDLRLWRREPGGALKLFWHIGMYD